MFFRILDSTAQTFTNNVATAPNSWNATLTKTITVSGLPSVLDASSELVQVNIHLGSQADAGYSFSRYTIILQSPAGTNITIVVGDPAIPSSFPNTANEINVKFRSDDGILQYPSVYAGSAEPWHIGYYKINTGSSFNNLYGEDPNGTWTVTITENGVQQGCRYNHVDLVFAPALVYNNIISSYANDTCSKSECIGTGTITIGTNNGFENPGDAATDPSTTSSFWSPSCSWNGAQNNSAWFHFVPSATTSYMTISGITASLQIIALKIKSGGDTCVANDWEILPGGCPKDLLNDDYISPQYFNGSDANMQLNLSGMTIGETYYLVVDGTGGAISPFSIEISNTTACFSPSLIADAGPDATICHPNNGGSVVIGGSPTASSGTWPYTYAWLPITGLNDATIANPTATPTSTTTYTVTVTDNVGDSDVDQITVTVYSEVIAGITNNSGTTELTCSATSISVTATGGGTYAWSGGLGSNADTAITIPGTYTVTVTTSGCTDTESITITQDIAAPTADITNNSGTTELTCTTTSISVTAIGGGTYSWSGSLGSNDSASITSPGIYTVTVTVVNGCTDEESIIITQDTVAPSADAGSDVALCPGDSAQLNANGGGSYSWSPLTGLSSSTIPNPVANPAATTTYTLLVTASNGCTDTDNIIVTINANPSPSASSNSPVCEESTLNLTSSGGNSYSWTGPNSFSSFSQNPSIISATTDAAGTYTVTVSDTNGCSAVAQTIVSITTVPDIDISSDAVLSYIYIGQTITFTAIPAGYDNYYFYIDNVLVQSGSSNVYTTSSLTGTPVVSVIATDNGCGVEGDSLSIEIKPIPNAFTPCNVDGVNDIFVKGLDLKIFNRWGQVLYKGKDGWDGTYNGNLVSPGTYYYIISLRDPLDNILKGTVSVVSK
ncbi:MAG: gliding motility-associated C-terminal domain-containing protein [Bacteroidales bacterium]